MADGACIAVGQDGFGAVLVADLLEARGDGGEGFVPGDALEGFVLVARWASGPFGAAGFAAQRIEDAVGGVDAVEILGDFAAEEALGDGLGGIAFDFDGAALLVDRDQDGAGVRAVVGADGVDDAEGGGAADMRPL